MNKYLKGLNTALKICECAKNKEEAILHLNNHIIQIRIGDIKDEE